MSASSVAVVLVAAVAGAAIEAFRVAHAVRTRRGDLEARLAGGASAVEAVFRVVGGAWRSAVAGLLLGLLTSGTPFTSLLAAIAGALGGKAGARFGTRRLFADEYPPDEGGRGVAFRNAPPVKVYDPDCRPRVSDDRDRRP